MKPVDGERDDDSSLMSDDGTVIQGEDGGPAL